MTNNGLLIIYTGNGKGKTTAALGMVFRALGRKMKVAVVQFIKGDWKTGERIFAETLPELTFLTMGAGFVWKAGDKKSAIAARKAWDKAKDLIESGKKDLVVLDEITYAINFGFITLEEVIEFLTNRPKNVTVLLSGRDAPKKLIEVADLVTEMKKIKHPFDKGVIAKEGIDY